MSPTRFLSIFALFCAGSLALLPPVVGQSLQDDLVFLLDRRPESARYAVKNEAPPSPLDLLQVSELKLVALGVLRLYQETISSQDMHSCTFTPSCSRYGVQALREAGTLKGLLLTSDRLMRCTGLPDQRFFYEPDASTGLLSDRIQTYLKWEEGRNVEG